MTQNQYTFILSAYFLQAIQLNCSCSDSIISLQYLQIAASTLTLFHVLKISLVVTKMLSLLLAADNKIKDSALCDLVCKFRYE